MVFDHTSLKHIYGPLIAKKKKKKKKNLQKIEHITLKKDFY